MENKTDKTEVDLLAPRFYKIFIDANADNWTEPSKECASISIEFAKGYGQFLDDNFYYSENGLWYKSDIVDVDENEVAKTQDELILEYITYINNQSNG